MDEDGFLMDEDGNYLYDENGEQVKLTDEQVEELRENNIIEENEE